MGHEQQRYAPQRFLARPSRLPNPFELLPLTAKQFIDTPFQDKCNSLHHYECCYFLVESPLAHLDCHNRGRHAFLLLRSHRRLFELSMN